MRRLRCKVQKLCIELLPKKSHHLNYLQNRLKKIDSKLNTIQEKSMNELSLKISKSKRSFVFPKVKSKPEFSVGAKPQNDSLTGEYLLYQSVVNKI